LGNYVKKIIFADGVSNVFKGLCKNLLEYKIVVVDEFESADIVICSSTNKFNEIHKSQKKSTAIMLWTNEPRWSSETEAVFELDGRVVLTMNCYTGGVYVDPFHYLWIGKYKLIPLLTSEEYDIRFSAGSALCCCIASQHGDGYPFLINGQNLDLYKKRTELTLNLKSRALCDVYGAGWPSGVAEEISQSGRSNRGWKDWEEEKLNLLSEYGFNIAFENTNSKYYITEKLWHPIMAKVLPIYFSGISNVYETLPKDSFIDYCNFESADELITFINSMEKQTYITRVNLLINRFNELMMDGEVLKKSRKKMATKIALLIHSYV
jgi:hypothetical protein